MLTKLMCFTNLLSERQYFSLSISILDFFDKHGFSEYWLSTSPSFTYLTNVTEKEHYIFLKTRAKI
jgi:hypothetical protein